MKSGKNGLMTYYMIIGHENHSGSAMGSNHTEDIVKREDKCSKENKYNYWKHYAYSWECREGNKDK